MLKLNGLDVDSTGEFRNAIAAAGAAAIVKLDVLRNGKSFAIDAKLGELPEKVGAAGGTTLGTQPGGLEGLTLEDLNPGLRQRLQLPSSVKSGVVVTQVDPGSPAGESGLHPGDVVLEVNRVAVTNVDAFKAAYTKAKDRALLRIVREGRTLYVVVKR
jgi:serine protease Do